MTKHIVAYHFLRNDYRSTLSQERPWAVGETRSLTGGRITPCARGYHGSPSLFDALSYAPGSVACLVELSGSIKPHGVPVDKYAARSRTLVAAVNIEYQLRMFAADCAEHVLHHFERLRPDDARPREAIVAARSFARGEIDTVVKLAAEEAARLVAWLAAEDAARSVAVSIAQSAAWSAAASAAESAARSAARSAAESAVWLAARSAADSAAWSAAESAESAAGLAAQSAAWSAAASAAWFAAEDAARSVEKQWQRATFDSWATHVFDGA